MMPPPAGAVTAKSGHGTGSRRPGAAGAVESLAGLFETAAARLAVAVVDLPALIVVHVE